MKTIYRHSAVVRRIASLVALALVIVAADARPIAPPRVLAKMPALPTIEIPVVEFHGALPLTDHVVPGLPRVLVFRGGIVPPFQPTLSPSADSIRELLQAFRTARHVEIWRTQRIENELPLISSASVVAFRYRDSLITGFRRDNRVSFMADAVIAIVSAISGAESADPAPVDPISFAEMLGMTGFSPDVVVTYAGPEAVRVEIDVRQCFAIVRTHTNAAIYELQQRDVAAVNALADGLRMPDNSRVVPAIEF